MTVGVRFVVWGSGHEVVCSDRTCTDATSWTVCCTSWSTSPQRRFMSTSQLYWRRLANTESQ